jgi:hypothetical protein
MAETTTKAAPKKPAAKPAAPSRTTESKKPVSKTAPAGKPAEKKAPVKKPAAVKASPAKTKAKTGSKAITISDEQRYRMVAEAAYYRAESNQFKSDPLRDWIEAENDIAALLSSNK